jgi:hypothetical protein
MSSKGTFLEIGARGNLGKDGGQRKKVEALNSMIAHD